MSKKKKKAVVAQVEIGTKPYRSIKQQPKLKK